MEEEFHKTEKYKDMIAIIHAMAVKICNDITDFNLPIYDLNSQSFYTEKYPDMYSAAVDLAFQMRLVIMSYYNKKGKRNDSLEF